MKFLITFALLMFTALSVFSQTPERMSYQAIIRNSDNTLASNVSVTLKIIIREGSVTGTNVYEENHNISTNTNGLVSVEIGAGVSTLGSFSAIAWHSGSYFVETQVDLSGGSSFSLIGTSQLLSVPYALHAKTAENVINTTTPAPYRSEIIDFTSSRTISNNDINNTVACTTSATLELTPNFSAMSIGDTINLEAHNGATLTVTARPGVNLNYTSGGSALFISTTGNVRFGLLRKSGENAFIISGQ